MPRIERIHITGPSPTHLYSMTPRKSALLLTTINERLQGCVLEYKAPMSCNWLPSLTFLDMKSSFQRFVGDPTSSGTIGDLAKSKELLRYIDISPPDDSSDYPDWDWWSHCQVSLLSNQLIMCLPCWWPFQTLWVGFMCCAILFSFLLSFDFELCNCFLVHIFIKTLFYQDQVYATSMSPFEALFILTTSLLTKYVTLSNNNILFQSVQ